MNEKWKEILKKIWSMLCQDSEWKEWCKLYDAHHKKLIAKENKHIAKCRARGSIF